MTVNSVFIHTIRHSASAQYLQQQLLLTPNAVAFCSTYKQLRSSTHRILLQHSDETHPNYILHRVANILCLYIYCSYSYITNRNDMRQSRKLHTSSSQGVIYRIAQNFGRIGTARKLVEKTLAAGKGKAHSILEFT